MSTQYHVDADVRMWKASPVAPAVQYRSVCASAVDEIDIAVLLETEGLNDSVAGTRYGVSGVHELAASLLAAVPTVISETDSQTALADTRIPYVRLATRGLIYAAPGLFFTAFAGGVNGHPAVLCLIVALVGGWALSQALAVVAYRLLARTGVHNTTRVLRWCVLALLPMVGAAFAATAPVAGLDVATVAAAQLLYVIAATVLLFHNADRWLAVTLLPGVIASGAYLTHWPARLPAWLPLAVFVLTATVSVVVACTVGSVPATRPAPRLQLPIRSEFASALPYASYGLLSALTVALPPLWTTFAGGSSTRTGLDITLLPLVLIMGYAEIELRWLRRSNLRLAAATRSLAGYRRGAVKVLVLTELRVAVLLAILSAAAGTEMWANGGLNGAVVTRMGAYLALGCALIAGLVVCALDQAGAAVAGFALAGAVIAVAACQTMWAPWPLSAAQSYLAVCLVLFGCLGLAAMCILRNPVHFA